MGKETTTLVLTLKSINVTATKVLIFLNTSRY